MVSPFSPPVLYLTDDDDDNETEPYIPYNNSYTSVVNDHLPQKKRRLPDTSVRINPSIINWSKRQRNDPYLHQLSRHNTVQHHEPERIAYNSDVYNFTDHESHSFHAFDWTTEPETIHRIHANPIQTTSGMTMVPPRNVMNVSKHHLDQSDALPIAHLSQQNERYLQHPHKKSQSIPISATSSRSLALPLPTPTASFVRPQAHRAHSGKNIRMPFSHSTPPPPPPSPNHHPVRPVFSPPVTHHSPAHVSILTPEIRRQPLNGTGILSAFYDSKCYRCNICKYITVSSSKLLQHLFTHVFFCEQCPFYSYSQHTLYQHIFEKHSSNPHQETIDPQSLDLLYITRCSDGTFALCVDSSSPPPPPSKSIENTVAPAATNDKPKPPKRKPRPKKPAKNEIAILPEKLNTDPQPLSSSTVAKRPVPKEKLPSTYVLMKHRRCYSIRNPACLHSVSLEYNICREHTIRHMCHTGGIFNRRKFKSKSRRDGLVDQVALCLKTIVNRLIDIEETSDVIYPLPNHILNSIFLVDELHTITNLLKLKNRYEKSIEQNELNRMESSVRTKNQHVFILSSTRTNKNEQSLFTALHTGATNADSLFTQTKLNRLPISCDNTHRFLKGNLNLPPQSTNSAMSDTTLPKPARTDKNNNSVPSPVVIVID